MRRRSQQMIGTPAHRRKQLVERARGAQPLLELDAAPGEHGHRVGGGLGVLDIVTRVEVWLGLGLGWHRHKSAGMLVGAGGETKRAMRLLGRRWRRHEGGAVTRFESQQRTSSGQIDAHVGSVRGKGRRSPPRRRQRVTTQVARALRPVEVEGEAQRRRVVVHLASWPLKSGPPVSREPRRRRWR
eukprot:scaffold106059_cov61-Phaeocystis_antarctica.AAC.2